MKECFKVLMEIYSTHKAISRNVKIYQYYPQNKISSEHMKRAASYLGEVEAWVVVAVPWQPHHKFFAINRQVQILIISFKKKKEKKKEAFLHGGRRRFFCRFAKHKNGRRTIQCLRQRGVCHGDAVSHDLALLVIRHHKHQVARLGDGHVIIAALVDAFRRPGNIEWDLARKIR